MKINVRRNIFETNSSSTHSLTMCKTDTFNRWETGVWFSNGRLIIENKTLKAMMPELG